MSDFRFKISGDSSPFIAELYNATTSCLIASQVVEYSGLSTSYCNYTCVIFDGLTENTNYYAKVTDNIGNIAYSCTGATPTNPVVVPTTVSVNLLGTYYSPTTCVCVLNAPKYIEITPAPQTGQCAIIRLCATACDGTTDDAYVNVYKRCGVGGSYSSVCLMEDDDDWFDVTVRCGDSICYEMSTVIDHPSSGVQCLSFACAELQIVNVSVSGYSNPVISTTCGCLDISQSCFTTTTTTTSTLSPVIVYFDNCVETIGYFTECETARLATFPALTSSQCFRVCFEVCNRYDICGPIERTISQCGCITKGATVVAQQSSSGINPDSCSFITSGFADVCQGNIDSICLCSRVTSHVTNSGCAFSEYQTIRICNITNMVGANYVYGCVGYPSRLCSQWHGWSTPDLLPL